MAKNKALVKAFNEALELEQAAVIQYLSHAQMICGRDSEPMIARVREIAGDELKHAETCREIIGSYLGGMPSMGVAETHPEKELSKILEINLAGKKHAVEVYAGILSLLDSEKEELKYEYHKLEHSVRHIIFDEEEHIFQLRLLLGL